IERCPVEREIDKGLRQRLATRQSDLAGGAAIVIDDEAFENIVDLVERHVEAQRRVAVNHGFIFEITDTAARQHDPLEREICGVNRPYYRQKSCRQPPSIHDRLPAENAQSLRSLWRIYGATGWVKSFGRLCYSEQPLPRRISSMPRRR